MANQIAIGLISKVLQINFFNNDTGFVSGFIQDENRIYDVYYRTTDRGRFWERRHFPDAGWADVVVHLNNGKAWASIAGSGHIDYSTDYGLSWTSIGVPNPKERYATIFFNDQGEGLIGSLWNVIAYTANNGRTWLDIPTPLSQHAYQKTNIESRPVINKVAIFTSYFLVEQEGQLFFSFKDSIHWRPLPYDDFVSDNNTNSLFFAKNNTLIKAGPELLTTASYTIKGNPGIMKCNNGILALWSNHQLTKIESNGIIATSLLYSDEAAVRNPEEIGYISGEGSIGYMGDKLYVQKEYNSNWVYKTTLPFNLKDRLLQLEGGDSLIVIGPGDSLLFYNLKTGKTNYTSVTALLTGFCSHTVQKVIFENGSRGCFHFYEDKVIYERDVDAFVLTDEASRGPEHKEYLKGYPDNFNAAVVDAFIHQLPATFSVIPTIQTIGINAHDYNQCRRDIQKFQTYVKSGKPQHDIEEKEFRLYKNNIDFIRLSLLTDSVMSMKPETVDSLLYNISTLWSTTSNWKGIRFVLENGLTLSIRNVYYEANSLHFPGL
jgi:hypothetical protein